jgi:hypothetical protein
MLQDVVTLLVLACDRLQLDGLLFVPSHYHIAVHGRKTTTRFLHPEAEGLYRALQRPFEGLSLAAATEAVAAGRVVDAQTGEPYAWSPTPMVFPVSDRFRALLDGEAYQKAVAEAESGHTFALR